MQVYPNNTKDDVIERQTNREIEIYFSVFVLLGLARESIQKGILQFQ